MEIDVVPVTDWLEPFDHRKALQLLSHCARTRNRRGTGFITFSFVVLFDTL
jgi:hypothetical protein